MLEENLIKLTKALTSAGFEITSYVEELDIYDILAINLKITPLHKDKKKDD